MHILMSKERKDLVIPRKSLNASLFKYESI